LKIAFVTYTSLPSVGGAQIMLHNIAARLSERGHEVIVFTYYRLYKKLGDKRNRLGYKIKPLYIPGAYKLLKNIPYWYMKFTDFYLSQLHKKYKFDVWFAWMSYPMGVIVNHWAYTRKTPHGIRCAGEDIQLYPEIGYGDRLDENINALVKKYLPRYSTLVALAENVALEYRKIGIEDNKIVFIPCGVDMERFTRHKSKIELKKKYGLPEDKTVFITVGRNHPKKGFKNLVEAAGIMKSKGISDFVIVFVGKDMENLIEMGKSLNIPDCLKFIEEKGSSNMDEKYMFPSIEIVELYQAADICAFPTLMETFALIVVEAWAANIPVITTDAPGTGEIVKDGENAIVVPVGNAQQLAQKMVLLMDNNTLQKKLIENGSQEFKDKYEWNKVIDIWERIFKDMVGRK
jgi:glycosyltransferase involved in cell wall biosynthesis